MSRWPKASLSVAVSICISQNHQRPHLPQNLSKLCGWILMTGAVTPEHLLGLSLAFLPGAPRDPWAVPFSSLPLSRPFLKEKNKE